MISEELRKAFNEEEGRCVDALRQHNFSKITLEEAERRICAAFAALLMKTEFEPLREHHTAWKLAVSRGETFKSLEEFAKANAPF